MIKIVKLRKKAISQVITTILLILIGITSVIIIAGVVIPFVKNILSEGKECFEVLGKLTINTESGYTCYYARADGNQTLNVTIKRSQEEVDIKNIKISIFGEGKSDVFDIKEDTEVSMYGGGTKNIPGKGEERTYSIETNLEDIDYAEIFPVMASGKICDATDKANLNSCTAA